MKTKRIIAILLALCLCIGLAACGGGSNTGSNANTNNANNQGNTNNSNNENNTGNTNNSNNANNTNNAENDFGLADASDELAKKCLALVKEKFGYTETALNQDINVEYLYGWEVYKVEKNNYYVAYAFDYDNNKRDDGFGVVGYDCVCNTNSDEIAINTPNATGMYDKYAELGFDQHRTYWPIDVNRGYFEDYLGMIEKPVDVLESLSFFFRNLGIQPFIYTTDEKVESIPDAAKAKYEELFEIEGYDPDPYHVLIYIHKGEDGNYSLRIHCGEAASRLLGTNCDTVLEDMFIAKWNEYEGFDDIVSITCLDAVIKYYSASYDSYYEGGVIEVPTEFVYIDTMQSTSPEFYPTIKLVSDTEFEYTLNLYEGMYTVGGTYYAVKDTNANTVLEFKISKSITEPEAEPLFNNEVFDIIDLGNFGIWLYAGSPMGMTWEDSLFEPAQDCDIIELTLK